jgi:hypothetical protein
MSIIVHRLGEICDIYCMANWRSRILDPELDPHISIMGTRQ